jgi:hypothetical protein
MPFVYPTIPNRYVPYYHKYTNILALIGTILAFFKACFSDPGIITKESKK